MASPEPPRRSTRLSTTNKLIPSIASPSSSSESEAASPSKRTTRTTRKPDSDKKVIPAVKTCQEIRKRIEDTTTIEKILKELMLYLEEPPAIVDKRNMVPSTKIAYYMSGPIAAGKSYTYYELFEKPDIPHHLYNVDKYQEYLLRLNHLLGDVAKTSTLSESEKNSITAQLMIKSRECAKEDLGYYDQKGKLVEGILTSNQETIVIDKPADTYHVIENEFYRLLQELGYKEQYMIFIYRSLEETLEGNEKRERKLHPRAVQSSWEKSIKNIPALQKLFGDKFYILNNSKHDITHPQLKGLRFNVLEEVKTMIHNNHKRKSK